MKRGLKLRLTGWTRFGSAIWTSTKKREKGACFRVESLFKRNSPKPKGKGGRDPVQTDRECCCPGGEGPTPGGSQTPSHSTIDGFSNSGRLKTPPRENAVGAGSASGSERDCAMPKEIPNCPEKPKPALDAGGGYDIELITPLFGAEPRVNDPSFPIRPTAIRGQLRFWWRATRGSRFTNLNDLWLREEEIFGGTRFQSPMRIHVSIDPGTKPQYTPSSEVQRFEADGYALFPLQKGDELLRSGLKFHVHLDWPLVEALNAIRDSVNQQLLRAKLPPLPSQVVDIAEDIEVAARAWLNFGGLGGRTRRGCGSLWCGKVAPKCVDDFASCYHSMFAGAVTTGSGEAIWPKLANLLFFNSPSRDPVDAWLEVIRVFKEFRQGKGFARHRGRGPRPGRSHFPEPETIRETLGTRSHPRVHAIPADAFPRAELGLPIVFQFQHNEVPQTVLYPRRGELLAERMASPLILKALALADKTAVPAIIPLDVPWFTDVDLTEGGRNSIRQTFPYSSVHRPNLATYANSPLAASANGSAIEAFLAFARSQGFTEVTP